MPSIDVNTFLTTMYCKIDDWYQAEMAVQKPVRPGPEPEVSDSEVLTLALLREWLDEPVSEAGFLALVAQHWRRYFPRLLGQSSFNRRVRDLWGVLCVLAPVVGCWLRTLQPPSAYAVADAVPVPLMRVCRGRRHRLFGPEADVGIGGSDKDLYYGVKLLLEVTQQGAITGFILGPAATQERWLLEALLRYRQDPAAPAPSAAEAVQFLGPSHHRGGGRVGPTGPLGPRCAVGTLRAVADLGDLGFSGTAWQLHWLHAYGTAVLTKDAYPDPRHRARFAHFRQVIETVNGFLVDRLHLKYPRVRTLASLYARVAAKIATYHFMLLDNLDHDRPALARPTPLLS